MTLPNDVATRDALLIKIANGNQYAANFLLDIAIAARMADNLADNGGKERVVGDLLAKCLLDIPSNPFFREHFAYLAAPINEAICGWQISSEFKDGDVKRKTFGYVYRESTDRIAIAVALITGGSVHARNMLREIYETCHAPFTETVEQWGAS